MNKGTQLIIGMLLGFEKGHEIFHGVDWSGDVAGELLRTTSISKEDVFSTTPNGKSFFEYKNAWENFPKLYDFMKKNGQTIRREDFERVLVKGKSIVELAIDCDALDALFTPELWAGRSEEMEDLWYSVNKYKRTNKDFEKIKTAVARLEGRESREAALRRMGIDPTALHNTLKANGSLDDYKKKLAAHGDHIRTADLLMCDTDGDTSIYAKSSWDNIDKLFTDMIANGERFDASFFLFKRGKQPSIVDRAFEYSAEKKVFNARVFAGRPDEMMKLYGTLKEEFQKRVDINTVVSEIVENDFASYLKFEKGLSLGMLTEGLYKPANDARWSPLIALGMKKTWEHMDDIRPLLRDRGERITLGLLLRPCGYGGESCLLRAARFGRFDKVLDVLRDSGETLPARELLNKNGGDKNVLDVLVQTAQLDTLLKPEIWAGRVGELADLWEHLPSSVQNNKRAAFQTVQTQANQLSLQAVAGVKTPALNM